MQRIVKTLNSSKLKKRRIANAPLRGAASWPAAASGGTMGCVWAADGVVHWALLRYCVMCRSLAVLLFFWEDVIPLLTQRSPGQGGRAIYSTPPRRRAMPRWACTSSRIPCTPCLAASVCQSCRAVRHCEIESANKAAFCLLNSPVPTSASRWPSVAEAWQ